MRQIASLGAIAFLSLAACSSQGEQPSPTASETIGPEIDAGPASAGSVTEAPLAGVSESGAASPAVLGLEGLGELKIGQPAPRGSSFAQRGAQESDSCRVVSSPDHPGVHAIVEGGKVRRITIGQRSDVKLAEGIGVGASEADVKKAFPGFREEGHKYQAAPAKYLTAPNARPGESALRFEIDGNGKVGLIHVGEMPVLAYVENCS